MNVALPGLTEETSISQDSSVMWSDSSLASLARQTDPYSAAVFFDEPSQAQEGLRLHEELRRLRARLESIERITTTLQRALEEAVPRVMPGRNIEDAQARQEIKRLFERHHGEPLYPSDVAEELRLDYDQVVQVIRALEQDGEIQKT